MGTLAGFPDLFFPEPRQNYHGMFIEMKYGKAKPTAAQDEVMDILIKYGYLALVADSFDKFKLFVDRYFK